MRIPLKQYSDLLGSYLKTHRFKVILLVVLLLGSIGAKTYSPQVMRNFIDAATSGGAMRVLLTAAIVFIGLAMLTQVLSVMAMYLGEKIGWLATNALREDLALHCLRLDMSFHNSKTPGEMIERIDGDVGNLSNFFARFMSQVLANIVLLAVVLAILFFEHWQVGLAMTAYSILTITALIRIRNIAVPSWKEAREASSDIFGFLEEHLAGTEDIRSSGATDYAIGRLHHFTRNRFQKEFKAGKMDVWLRVLTDTFYTIGQIMAIGLGYYLFTRGEFTVGTVFMVLHYTDTLFRPLRVITREMEDLQKASASILRIQELKAVEPEITYGEGQGDKETRRQGDKGVLTSRLLPLTPHSSPLNPYLPSQPGPLAVDFQDVTFSYNDDEVVLNDITFRLAPGKVLGLLGRTGSGKTTITRLLFRLYEAQYGTIRVGDVDIRDAQLMDLRFHIGMVTQSVQLFRASVRDNLTFFDETVSDEKMLSVLKDVGLWDWYESLPEGLDTELQSGGKGLSAGEAQLLTFARVFLKDPGLVILDEASSRLDPATEQLIERAVDKLLHNRTAIIIAHRLVTVERADEIMILEDGRIREYGIRAELAADPSSRFSKLLRTGLQEVLS